MWSAYVYDYTQTTVTPICFYASVSPDLDVGLISPKLSLKKNEAGSFTFTLPPTNRGNDYIRLMTSLIEVKKDDVVFWRGRVIAEERDCYDQRSITCEGGLNFLLDSVQLPMHVNGGILTWLQYLLTTDYHDQDAPEGQYHRCHNYFFNSTETFKKFNIAYFDPNIELSENADWYANYETTSELLKNVLEAYDIKMEVTFENGLNNLWFYKDYPSKYQSQQMITFGKNLIKYTRNWDVEDLATVIIPTGSKVDADEERPTVPYTPPDLDAVETIQSVNSGSVFLEADSEIIARYGRVYKKIEWNDISQPSNLLDLAQNYFQNYQFDKLTIEVELYDLSIMMTGSEKAENELHLLGTVECVSKPHGLDKWFPITEINYDFTNPGNTKYVLGDAIDSTMSGTLADSNNQLNTKINNNVTSSSSIYNMVDEGLDTKIDTRVDTALEPYDTATTIHSWVLNNCYQKSETYNKAEVSTEAAAQAQSYYENNISDDMTTAANTAIEQAKTNAGTLINGFGEGGYVIFKQGTTTSQGKTAVNEIIISDILNYMSSNAHVWRWNQNGLGYFPNGYGSGTPNVAITKDGAISADFITTGSMSAARITSGTMSADRIYGGSIASTDTDSGGRHNLTFNLQTGHMFARNLFIETPSTVTCPSDGYIYLGTGDWSQNSIWSNGSNTITVGGYTEHNWRCILGSHFGVTADGVVACNYMKAGNVLVGGDFIRTITTQGNLGNAGTFVLSGSNTSILFGTEGTYAVSGVSRSDWRLSVGNNFGVTSDGILYSNQGHFASATVDGTVNAGVFSAFTLAYGNTSQYFGSSVVQNDSTSEPRWIDLKVVRYGTSNGYPYMDVAGYIVGSSGSQLNSDYYRLQFYCGTFNDPYNGPYNRANWIPNSNTVYELNVPSGTTSSNPVTKRIQGVNGNLGALGFRAVYIKSNYDSYTATSQLVSDPGNNGFGDAVRTNYVISGTRHNAVQFNCSLAPVAQMDGQELLGGVGNMWKQLYASTGSIYTSARMRKYDITSLTDNFDIFFDRLRPVSFRMKKDDDKRKHNGFVLDEVAEALAIAEIPKSDFAGYEEFKTGDELGDGGLRYSEFIAINTDQIQKAKKRISELEERIAALERGNL